MRHGRPPDTASGSGRRAGRRREAALIAACTLALAAALELILGYLYFQKHAERPSAIAQAADAIGVRLARLAAEGQVAGFEERWGASRKEMWDAFFSGDYPILAEFEQAYARDFARLAALAGSIGSRLVVAYIPSLDEGAALARSRRFFASLAAKHQVDFIDLTDHVGRYPRIYTHYAPDNIHLTRFGNRLVAEALHERLTPLAGYRSGVAPRRHDGVFGDLPPSRTVEQRRDTDRPYQVVSNAYGFRMDYDFPADTPRQKILVLGDSFTYGPYLPNADIYTTVLDELLEDAVVMNAGIEGYSIFDEVQLYEERAMHIAPDITLLQVLDNDLFGYFYFLKRSFARDRRAYQPTPSEEAFFRALAGNRPRRE